MSSQPNQNHDGHAADITWEEAVLWLRAQPDQQELVRACFFDDPLPEAAARYEASEEWQAVRAMLPGGKGIALDLGAGRGISSFALAQAGWQVDALEPDPSEIVGRGAIESLATKTSIPIRVLDGFAEQIPVSDEGYDLVFGRQVMHHAQNLPAMCREIFRVLKPGGTFIATREHVISRREDLPTFLATHPLNFLYGGEHAFLLQEYCDALAAAGFQVRAVLGPLDSPINYFPMSRKQWRRTIQAPVAGRIGRPLTRLLLSDVFPWSRQINLRLARRASESDDAPGRLYSFLAHKP